MEKEFVTYEIALKLKELGFNEPCFGYYLCNEKIKFHQDGCGNVITKCQITDHFGQIISAPLWQQAEDFLFDKYEMIINKTFIECVLIVGKLKGISYTFESEEVAILKAIELIQNNK